MSEKLDMWVAPKREGGYWTASEWIKLTSDEKWADSPNNWKTAIQIFEDRINFRFLQAIETLKKSDDAHYKKFKQRRFGFAATALMALLIETLAQFYAGVEESDGSKRTYVDFLSNESFVFKNYFKTTTATVFYDTIRCGIFHQAETKNDSLIRYHKDGDRDEKIPFDSVGTDSLIVYWATLFKLLKQEIEEYTKKLRSGDDENLRNNFKKKMGFICHQPNP